jgi:hypothetical protein
MTHLPDHVYQVEVIQSLLSDHYAQAIVINMNVTVDNTTYRDMRDLSEANLTGLCLLLKSEDWTDVFRETDVNKKWQHSYNIFHYYFNTACPFVRKKILSTSNNKWINDEIRPTKSKLQFLYELYKETKDNWQ